jgi:hypothetical protein
MARHKTPEELLAEIRALAEHDCNNLHIDSFCEGCEAIFELSEVEEMIRETATKFGIPLETDDTPTGEEVADD